MQSEIFNEMLNVVNAQLLGTIIQFIVVGVVVMYLRALIILIVNFWALKSSDFGRESKIGIDGFTGFIKKIGIKEVEVELEDNSILIIPVKNFIKANKIIFLRDKQKVE